jgi:hypothetical protein
LIGAPRVEPETILGWLPAWEADFREAGAHPMASVSLSAVRIPYYHRGIEALLSGESPRFALWPLLSTWNRAMLGQPDRKTTPTGWTDASEQLGLTTLEHDQHLSMLDNYLDQVEETLDTWASENGA